MKDRNDSGALPLLLGRDRRMRIRVGQWLVTVPIYVGSALIFGFSASHGWTPVAPLLAMCGFVLVGMVVFYVALRTGWSARFDDAGLTSAQIVLGIVTICAGYAYGGPLRGVVLMPLLLAFTFGAFSLGWRRMTELAVFASIGLAGTIVVMQADRGAGWSFNNPELRVDLANLAMVLVLLPAVSLTAARMASLRMLLREDRAALRVALDELQRLATHDELTGLANRRHMQQLLDAEEARFRRHRQPFSVAVVDLDHFKQINDAHGHAVGDEVLQQFATAAASELRSGDVLARWGGEEFLVLMPGTEGEQARATLLRLLERTRALALRDGPLSFSAGVAEVRDGESVEGLLARADARLYQAKRAGRGRVVPQ